MTYHAGVHPVNLHGQKATVIRGDGGSMSCSYPGQFHELARLRGVAGFLRLGDAFSVTFSAP
jgi:hypothetical protein